MRARPTPRLARALALALPLLLLAVAWPGAAVLALVWDLLLLGLFAVDLRRLRSRVVLRLSRQAAPRLSVGAWNEVVLHAESLSDLPLALRLQDACPAEFELEPGEPWLRLAPFGRGQVRYRVRPPRRGLYRFGDLAVEVSGPLGLAALAGSEPIAAEARVYPDLAGLRRLALGARRGDLTMQGLRALRREGQGDEFEGLRDYRPDDDFANINWKATARRTRPVTQVYVAERSQRILLAIDCGRSMAARSGELLRLDHAINAALVLGWVALRMGDLVGLAVFSTEVRALLPPRRGRQQFARLVEALYAVREELTYVDYRALAREVAARRLRRGLIVLFTDVLDETASRPLAAAARLLGRKHATLVVTPSDPLVLDAALAPAGNALDVYRSLAAREALEERRVLLGGLRALGVDVVDARGADLTVAAVNRYLELRRRRILG